MNIEEFRYSDSNLPKDSLEKSKLYNQLKEEIRDDLRTNERYKSFFEEYDPKSWEHFIVQYANHKVHIIEIYKYYYSQVEESREVRYRQETEGMLHLIMQKKLFNLQLQWRAEHITLPMVNTTHEFRVWEKHVDRCPFIEPITEAEVEAMKAFLMDENFSDTTHFWLTGWQDYRDFMMKNEEGELDQMPEWYVFYDNRLGTGDLLLLPDIRGEKEEYYEKKAREHDRKENPEKYTYTKIAYKKSISADQETIKKFMDLFEDDPYIKLLQKGVDITRAPKTGAPEEELEQVEEAIRILEDAEFEPPLSRGGLPWYEEVIRSAHLYKNMCISKELDGVYQEKKMLGELGIGKSLSEKEFKKEADEWSVTAFNNWILMGRELSGEPRDFNF